MARPVRWDEDKKKAAIEQIISRICEGESVRSILDHANRDLLPAYVTFLEWVAENEELAKQYAKAMEIRSDKLFDEIIEIADESNADISVSDDGKITVIGEAVSRSRLRVDARKWALSKMMPKKYGDKIEVEQTVTNNESPKAVWNFVDASKPKPKK